MSAGGRRGAGRLRSEAERERLARALEEAFRSAALTGPGPGAVSPLRPLDLGMRSLVVETAGGVVVRIGRNAAAAAGHALEARVLPELRARLPVAAPEPRWHAPPCRALPFGAIAYPKLPGRPLAPDRLSARNAERLAADVALVMLALHRLPPEAVRPLPLPRATSAPDELERLRRIARPTLERVATRRERAALDSWWRARSEEPAPPVPPAPRHGDLWYGNLLVDETGRALSAVLDFEEIAWGDPADDLATQLHLGVGFAARVLAAYQAGGGSVDASLPDRVWRSWERRELAGLCAAVEQDDADEIEDAVRKLRRGPILDPEAARERDALAAAAGPAD